MSVTKMFEDLEAVLAKHGVPINHLDISDALDEFVELVEDTLEDIADGLQDEVHDPDDD